METKKVDIRQAKPVLKRKLAANVRAKEVLNSLHVYKSGEEYFVLMENNEEQFFNELDLTRLIFLIALFAKCKLCIAERTINKYNFPYWAAFLDVQSY